MLGRSRFRSRARYLAGGAFPNASLYLNLLSGTLDSRVTFSRDSNATLVDGTGRIVYAPANLLLRSEEFNDAVWSTGGTTSVTANTTAAPNGALTSDTLTASVGTFPHQIVNAVGMGVVILANTTYATSIYVKAGTFSFFQLYMASAPFGVDAFANFNLATGTVGTVGSAATASIQNVGNGWYRCSVVATATAAATGSSARVNFAIITSATAPRAESWTATGTETLFVWGAQLEPVTYQTVPGPYVATTSAAYYGPRFDYNPVTLAPLGLLIEEQRVNLQTYSQDWSNAVWNKTNITVTAAATVSPSGVTDAQRIAATATAATLVSATPTAVAATSATFSIYVKQGTGPTTANTFLLRNSTTATILIAGTINYATGVWTYSTGSTGVIVSNAGNGWWRLQMTATTGITSGDLIHGYVGWGGSTATAGDSLFAWGAQLEAGSFATSYIPTVASQVTRLADVATMTGTNFSSWYNQPAGTFVVDGDTSNITTVDFPLTANDGSNNNRFGVYRSNLSLAGYVVTGNVTQMELTAAVAAVNTTFRVAVAATANNGNVAINGNIGAGDTSITMPTVDRLSIGSNNGAGLISGHIRQIAYFNTRLPNAQLEALTAPPLITSLSLDFLNGVYEG